MKKAMYQPRINPIQFTQDGYDTIIKEQAELKEQRKDALVHLQKSRELGDLKENGYYQASRQKLNQIDSRLRRITFLLRYAVISTPTDSGTVEIGNLVTLTIKEKEYKYRIVGGEESNPSEGKVSHRSPLGRAVLGRKKNESVSVLTPGGVTTYTITSIE